MRTCLRVLRPLVYGVLFRPVLLAVVCLVFAVLFGLGASLGVPGLFWDENPRIQFAAGLGVGLVLFEVCFIGYLLDDGRDSDAAPEGWEGPADYLMGWVAPDPTEKRAGTAAADEHWQGLRWYLLATWVPLLLVLTLASLFYGGAPDAPRWPLRLGLLGAIATTALFLQLFQFLRKRLGGPQPPPAANLRKEIALHTLVALTFGVVLVPPWPDFPTLLWCFLAGCWAAAHGALLARYHVPHKPAHAWKHFLAGALFGTFFVIYQLLFLSYCLSRIFPAAADWFSPPPALVLCGLVALLVNAHGFLSFHYRGRHYFAAAALVALIGWSCSVLSEDPFPLRFAHLADYYAHPVRLGDADYQAALADAVQKDKEGAESADSLRTPFDHLRRRYLSERQRGGDLPSAGEDSLATRQALGDEFDRLRTNLLDREERRLEVWRKRLMKGNEPPKLVVVAVSGGAARAAFWTARVLDQLEQTEELRPFPAHVRVITGASGGMVGAAHWAATLEEDGHPAAAAYSPEDLARDNLTPVADALLFADLPTWPSGHARDTDRGRALEAAWNRSCPEFDRGFRDLLAPGEAAGWRPSLIFSPMFVEDGRRLLISNLFLPFLTENAGETLSTQRDGGGRPRGRVPPDDDPASQHGRYRYSVQALEFFHLFPEADDFRLGTAARMSAAFPYVSPAAELPTQPRRRVVDAGYYDDYGVDLAANWICHYRRWIAEKTSGVVLIQVRDAASSDRILYSDQGSRALRDLEWLTGPLAGLLNARQSVMSFRNDEEVQALNGYFNVDRPRREMFTTVVFESTETIEMNWRLTPEEQGRLTKGLDAPTNQAALKKLKGWWAERHDLP